MHRRLSPAQYVVVHARHVVVDQRISVDQLHRTRGTQRSIEQERVGWSAACCVRIGNLTACEEGMFRRATLHRFGGCKHQQGTQALATIEHCVAHGVAQASRGALADPVRERSLDTLKVVPAPAIKIQGRKRRRRQCNHSCVHGCN